MCGIGGIVGFNQALPVSKVEALFNQINARGGHACGVGWLGASDTNASVWKAPVQAYKAVQRGVISNKVTESAKWAMMHTRFATHGSIENNGNNHPIVRRGEGIILTHNGMISNFTELFADMGITQNHAVDSEVLNAILRHESVEYLVDNVLGSYSIAWVDTTVCNETIHLMTNGNNPLVIGRTTQNQVVWASCLHHLEAFELDDYFHAMPFKQYTITPQGVIRSVWIDKDRSCPPQIIGRRYTGSVYGGGGSTTLRTKTKASSRVSRGSKASSKQASLSDFKPKPKPAPENGVVVGGWVFDESVEGAGAWRKATRADIDNALFDEHGRLR